MEDRSRRSNVRLVDLGEHEEGEDAIGFLRKNLPKWIPLLAGRDTCIERAQRMYSVSDKNSSCPRTIIFKLLDRQDILRGVRDVFPVKHRQQTLLFFPHYSLDTAKKRMGFSKVQKNIGLQTFLLYPAQLKLTHKENRLIFKSSQEAEEFLQSKIGMGRNVVQRGADTELMDIAKL
ncbi:hypothetical protein AAFF_G00009310 [Aldrovandia affinis]|uniref:Uncharacterized protein n=1 Tax=Aldrovandia affinis TaxID=143900 RepID=A0AAD7T7A5_9TELE|nr:hypothetical protein AAFF_G00009310 [Aldrovandia affinis]